MIATFKCKKNHFYKLVARDNKLKENQVDVFINQIRTLYVIIIPSGKEDKK